MKKKAECYSSPQNDCNTPLVVHSIIKKGGNGKNRDNLLDLVFTKVFNNKKNNKMKNKFILISLALSIFASCNKSDDLMNIEGKALASQTQSIESLPYYVENGALNFRSADDFFFYADSIANLSGYDFENWEKVTGFTSYRSITDKMIEEIEEAEDDALMYNRLLLDYSEFVEKVGDRIEPKIKSNIYRSVVNKDGVFYTNGIRNLVDDQDVTVSNEDGKEERSISYVAKPLTRATTGNASLPLGVREAYGDKRMVFTEAKILRIYAAERYRAGVEVLVDGKKKGPAKWKHYATEFRMRDFIVRLPGVAYTLKPDGHAAIVKEVEQLAKEECGNYGNAARFIRTIYVGEMTLEPLDIRYPTYLFYRAWSRGVPIEKGVNYEVINGVLQ